MTFPTTYAALETNQFSLGEYSIVPIRYEDRLQIMKWRNEQIYHLRQNEVLTAEKQESYFKNTVSKLFIESQPNQILFSYLKGDICVGYGGLVHINWVDKNAEISFIMNTSLEEMEYELHWRTFLQLIEQVAFQELKMHKIFTYAFNLRPHLYEVLEKTGFFREATLKSHCYFESKYLDVIIHSKINYEIVLRKVELRDNEITYQWASDSTVRQNSFNSNLISFADHQNWFENKIKDKGANYFIVEADGMPAGLIRFDTTDQTTTIGILIDENFRGKGLAATFLKMGCLEFRKISSNVIKAFIKKENLASIKSFQKAGFRLNKELLINNNEAYEYEY